MEVGKAHSSIWPSVVCMSSCSSRCCPSLGLPCWPLLPASPVSSLACCSCVCADAEGWVANRSRLQKASRLFLFARTQCLGTQRYLLHLRLSLSRQNPHNSRST